MVTLDSKTKALALAVFCALMLAWAVGVNAALAEPPHVGVAVSTATATITGTILSNPERKPIPDVMVTVSLAVKSGNRLVPAAPPPGSITRQYDQDGRLVSIKSADGREIKSMAMTDRFGRFTVQLDFPGERAEAVVSIAPPQRTPIAAAQSAQGAVSPLLAPRGYKTMIYYSLSVARDGKYNSGPFLVPPMRVAGVVVDQQGKPLEGVTVRGTLREARRSSSVDQMVTGKDGRFELRHFPDVSVVRAGAGRKGVLTFLVAGGVRATIDDLYAKTPKELADLRVVIEQGR